MFGMDIVREATQFSIFSAHVCVKTGMIYSWDLFLFLVTFCSKLVGTFLGPAWRRDGIIFCSKGQDSGVPTCGWAALAACVPFHDSPQLYANQLKQPKGPGDRYMLDNCWLTVGSRWATNVGILSSPKPPAASRQAPGARYMYMWTRCDERKCALPGWLLYHDWHLQSNGGAY